MAFYNHRQEKKISKRVLLVAFVLSVAGLVTIAVMFFYQLQSEMVGDLTEAPATQTLGLDDTQVTFDESFFESAGQPEVFESQRINDDIRRQSIDAIHQGLTEYFAINSQYPDLADINSDKRRTEIFPQLEGDSFIDPDDRTGKATLTRTPQKNVFSYSPVDQSGYTCEPVGRICVSYELAATLSDGTLYKKESQ